MWLFRHVRQMEHCVQRMQEESERRGELVEQQVVILDLKDLSFKPSGTGLNIFKETIRIDQVSSSLFCGIECSFVYL